MTARVRPWPTFRGAPRMGLWRWECRDDAHRRIRVGKWIKDKDVARQGADKHNAKEHS